jgi:hypothetical protein
MVHKTDVENKAYEIQKIQIYVVRTEADVEGNGRHILGYAIGDAEQIKQFYDDARMYTVNVDPVDVLKIDAQAVSERKNIVAQKAQLEQQIKEMTTQIEGLAKIIGK